MKTIFDITGSVKGDDLKDNIKIYHTRDKIKISKHN